MQISIQPARTRAELEEFIRFPRHLYRDHPYWVPHLLRERRRFFDPDRNPLFEFTDARYLLARDASGRVVGRVTAHVNHRQMDYRQEKAGCFGFFECIEEPAVGAALLEAAEEWLREREMELVRGPLNFSTNEECGFLARGFDSRPAIMMPYNPPHYLEFVEQAGYRKARDLLAFRYEHRGPVPEYLTRFGRRIRERTGVSVRPIDTSRFEEEIQKVLQVYNDAWSRNWGFVPMSEKQFRYMAREMRPILDPRVALIAEKDRQPVGFMLALPDYNPVFQRMDGRLFPLGWLRLLLGRRSIDRVRILTMGAVQRLRNRGIGVLLYREVFRNGLERGYHRCEMSWILEDNRRMIGALRRMGAEHYKTYRIYKKSL